MTWRLTTQARETFDKLRRLLGDKYDDNRNALQDWLCQYSNTTGCTSAAMQVSPIGSSPAGGRVFKARWAYPGQGKRGGLRLVVVAYCAEPRAVVGGAWLRKADPTDAQVAEAAANADRRR